MKIEVIMSDNRPLTDNINLYHNICAYATNITCQQKGYKFTYYIPSSYTFPEHACFDPNNLMEPRHPAWAKILACYHHLKTTSCDFLLYLDTDSFLLPTCNLLETFKHEINFQNDRPFNENAPCSGVFCLKNNITTLAFLEHWYKINLREKNTARSWEQNALCKIQKQFNIHIENQYIYFIDKTDRHDYSSDVYHIIKWLAVKDHVSHISRVSECVQKFYDLTNVMQQKDKVRSVKLDTDIYNTLEKW